MSCHVAIVLVAFDNEDDVSSCLKALQLSTYRNYSVCIVENHSHESFARLCRLLSESGMAHGAVQSDGGWVGTLFDDYRPVRILSAPDNPGYAGGINRCLPYTSEADAVWILNPDTEPQPSALSALLARLESGGFGIVGGRLVNPESHKIQLYGGRWRRWMARGFNIGRGARENDLPDIAAIERDMDYVNGACMLVSRAFLDTVGPMQDDYFLYCEEVDWCLRRGAFRLGYAHDALVYHAHGTTIGSNLNRFKRSALSVYLDERNKLLLTRRHFPAIYPVVIIITLVLTAQYLRHGALKNFAHALSGWWAGISSETGKPRWVENRAAR